MFTSVIIPGPPDESDSFSHELRGVIPRGFEYMFSLINREQEKVSHDSLSSIVWIGGELSIGEEKIRKSIRDKSIPYKIDLKFRLWRDTVFEWKIGSIVSFGF